RNASEQPCRQGGETQVCSRRPGAGPVAEPASQVEQETAEQESDGERHEHRVERVSLDLCLAPHGTSSQGKWMGGASARPDRRLPASPGRIACNSRARPALAAVADSCEGSCVNSPDLPSERYLIINTQFPLAPRGSRRRSPDPAA